MDQGYDVLERAVQRLLNKHVALREEHAKLLAIYQALQEENALLRQGKTALDSRVRQLLEDNDALRQKQREAAARIGALIDSIDVDNQIGMDAKKSEEVDSMGQPGQVSAGAQPQELGNIPRQGFEQQTINGMSGERLF